MPMNNSGSDSHRHAGDATSGGFDPLERGMQGGSCVHGAQAVMPGAVEMDALIQRGGEEPQRHDAVVASCLSICGRLLIEAEQQTEARSDRLHPDGKASLAERFAQSGVQHVLQVLEVRPELCLCHFVQECIRGQDRNEMCVECPTVDCLATR